MIKWSISLHSNNLRTESFVVNQNPDKCPVPVFVSVGEGEELASGLLIKKGLAIVSQPSDCPNRDALIIAEELLG